LVVLMGVGLGGGVITDTQRLETSDDAKRPTVHRQITKMYLAQNVNSAELRNPGLQ
jgi:hypothetical protein